MTSDKNSGSRKLGLMSYRKMANATGPFMSGRDRYRDVTRALPLPATNADIRSRPPSPLASLRPDLIPNYIVDKKSPFSVNYRAPTILVMCPCGELRRSGTHYVFVIEWAVASSSAVPCPISCRVRRFELVLFLPSVTLHTDLGDIKVELFCEACPKTCENFLALCASDYYNGCVFHRNIKGFIVQTGDPTDAGKGGNSIWGAKFEDEFNESLKHNARGMVSMANNGPNTNGSQFFITYAAHPHLDLNYTIFGKVIDGFDVLDDLEKLPVNPKNYRPLTDKKISRVTVHANPIAG